MLQLKENGFYSLFYFPLMLNYLCYLYCNSFADLLLLKDMRKKIFNFKTAALFSDEKTYLQGRKQMVKTILNNLIMILSFSHFLLLQEGVILVGGNSTAETSISLTALAAKQQSIVGIPKGNLNQLMELIGAVKENKVSPCSRFSTFSPNFNALVQNCI